MIVAYSCNSDDNTVTQGQTYEANSINGKITFADTNYYAFSDTSKGYFNISAFATWPPTGPASANSKLVIKKEAGIYVADYKLVVPGNGDYVVTTSYIKLPYLPFGSVFGLGTYQCDTSHSAACIFATPPSKIAKIENNNGLGNINFFSWIDTTKQIYKF